MKIADVREKIVEKLRLKGLIEKEEDYIHNIATARELRYYRTSNNATVVY